LLCFLMEKRGVGVSFFGVLCGRLSGWEEKGAGEGGDWERGEGKQMGRGEGKREEESRIYGREHGKGRREKGETEKRGALEKGALTGAGTCA
jgi:hypothetical protein